MSVVLRRTETRAGTTSDDGKSDDWKMQAERLSIIRDGLLHYCEFLSGSTEDAQDLVQDTLLKALPYVQGHEAHPNVPALLKRIAKNTWLDHVRKHAKCQPYGPVEMARLAGCVSLEETSSLQDALRLLIQTLTPQQRAAVLLCDIFQFTDREAGEILEISVGAVKATLHRARCQLRRLSHETGRAAEAEDACDAAQYQMLEAYMSAFQAADIRGLVQLCYDGALDPVQAIAQVLPLAVHQSRRMHKEPSVLNVMTNRLSSTAALAA